MFGKCLKHDLRAIWRVWWIAAASAFGMGAVGSLAVRGIIEVNLHIEEVNGAAVFFLSLALSAIAIAAFFAVVAFCVISAILVYVRFFKNFFSDEGYLTHTLPVKKGTLLIAKVIAGTIWCIIDIIGLFAAIYIAAWVPYVKDSLSGNKALLMEIFGLGSHLGVFGSIAFYIFFMIAGTVANVILYYACISLGQIFTGHRVFGAVAMYFIVTFVESISCFLIFIPLGLLNTQSVTIGTSTTLYMSTPSQYMLGLLGISLALMIIWSVILYIITYYRLNRKLNLA